MPELLPNAPLDPLDEAEAAVRAYCGWHIAPNRATTDTFRSHGGRVLLLKSLRVTAVATVTIDATLIESDRYDWYEHGSLVLKDPCGSWPCGKVVVSYSSGYAVAAIGDLHGVIRSIAGRGTPGTYVQVGQVRIATDQHGAPLGATATGAERAILDRYKLPPRP